MSTPPLRALVVTVVHHPSDSRIRHRELAALLEAGWEVTYAAPFEGYGIDPETSVAGLTCVHLPRARGRRRLGAARAARALLRREAPRHDVVLVHDPELLLAATGLGIDHLVWDVHEDPAAALVVKEWVPAPLRRAVAGLWRLIEGAAERRWTLLLAEHAYQQRFRRAHAVVPNTVRVPAAAPTGSAGAPAEAGAPARVVYLGTVTMARGCAAMVETARRLQAASDGAITVDIIGPAVDPAAARLLQEAGDQGVLRSLGFVPSDRALGMLDGALCGLALLQDLPNYRPSMPTKALEYLAHGVPVITTPLPLAVELVTTSGGGVVVPFDDPAAVTEAVLRLWRDPAAAHEMGTAGRAYVAEHHDWRVQGPAFVAALAEVAAQASPRRRARTSDSR